MPPVWPRQSNLDHRQLLVRDPELRRRLIHILLALHLQQFPASHVLQTRILSGSSTTSHCALTWLHRGHTMMPLHSIPADDIATGDLDILYLCISCYSELMKWTGVRFVRMVSGRPSTTSSRSLLLRSRFAIIRDTQDFAKSAITRLKQTLLRKSGENRQNDVVFLAAAGAILALRAVEGPYGSIRNNSVLGAVQTH